LVTRVDAEFSQAWYRLANLYQHAGRSDDAAKALARFRSIKTTQTDLETEYLRKEFLSALGAEQPGADNRRADCGARRRIAALGRPKKTRNSPSEKKSQKYLTSP